MTPAEWMADVVEAAATLGYRVDALSWRDSTVTLTPPRDEGASITIRSLFLTGGYLLSHLRPGTQAPASAPSTEYVIP